MSEWREYFLDEVYNFTSGLSKSADQFGFGHPFLSFKDVFDNYFIPKELSSLANTSEKEQELYSIKKGDVFLTRTSETEEELGMSSVALVDYPCATFNGFTKRLRPKGTIEVIPEYAGYYFRSPRFRATVTSLASMTTRASLNNSMLATLKISIPRIEVQKAIGETLKSLDDKIDLLHRQNKTLEALAETLFRQWFVGEASNAVKGQLGDILQLVYGKALKETDRSSSGFPVVGSSGIVGYHSKYLVSGPGIVIGRKGTLGKVVYLFENFFPIDTTYYVQSKLPSDGLFYEYFLLKTLDFGEMNTDSAVPGLNRDIALSTELKLPDSKKLTDFNNFCRPLFQKIQGNGSQIHTLTSLRDTLLPKLMSGEVRVRDVEQQTNTLLKQTEAAQPELPFAG